MIFCQTQMELLSNPNEICVRELKEKSRIIVSISELCGSGKSTLEKCIRKQGFDNFKPHQIA
ncbi:hypothetical protein [Helicobacter canadensis]|uniref:Uncharacterized protein n=1 Tax=Helicobacter canadensis MIT 98-5491 TaxID=537970 RepID=C5ZYS1_9HELI|nr:hypothetical protein [Helicobacter canadensis]EES89179.1 hypothetical protein HCAN_0462 [Helicobacter canadensis MIT 98-5491]EFR47961.1 hypothetical protein HCMG_00134 [Helicobacter canadensis MIT 98-5491]STO99212.1 Uncharacterised protein [Helicobacter canadensis]